MVSYRPSRYSSGFLRSHLPSSLASGKFFDRKRSPDTEANLYPESFCRALVCPLLASGKVVFLPLSLSLGRISTRRAFLVASGKPSFLKLFWLRLTSGT
jgi:hypothetical protein